MISTRKIALFLLSLNLCTHKSHAASLTTPQKVGIGAAVAVTVAGLAWWLASRETEADIPVYLAKVESDLIAVEAHAYTRAWANGPDWQAWMCNQVLSQPNAAGIQAILAELRKLKETLQLPLLARAHKLAIDNNTGIERCTQYKVRAERLRASVDEMIRMAEPVYTQRYAAERLESMYADYRARLQNVATSEILIDLRDIRNRALRAFPTSNWPYADAVYMLENYKDRLNSLLREVNAAEYHPDQQMLLGQTTQLRDGILWAISELQNAPEYAQQMRLKRTADEQNAERVRLENQRRQMDEELRRRNEELRLAQERQQRELDELRRRERQQAQQRRGN